MGHLEYFAVPQDPDSLDDPYGSDADSDANMGDGSSASSDTDVGDAPAV